MSQTTPWK